EETRPLVGAPRGAGDSVKAKHARKVQRNHPDGEHRPDRDPSPASETGADADRHAARDEYDAEERNPGLVHGDPAGNERADEFDADKVIDTEDDHGDGDHDAAGDGKTFRSGGWTGQQQRNAGERQRLEDHGTKAHVAGRSYVIRKHMDERPEDVSGAKRVSGRAHPAPAEKADGTRDPESTKEDDEPRNRRQERENRHAVRVRAQR